MSIATIIELVVVAWVALSVVLGLAVGRAFADGQRELTPGRARGGRPGASPALPR